jgi:uncharacterized membrane protein HdeD (DUF308 family)
VGFTLVLSVAGFSGRRTIHAFPAHLFDKLRSFYGHDDRRNVSSCSGWAILWGVFLIILGIVAVGEPFVAALAINVFLAWLLLLAGVVHLVIAFHAHSAGNILWKVLVGWRIWHSVFT